MDWPKCRPSKPWKPFEETAGGIVQICSSCSGSLEASLELGAEGWRRHREVNCRLYAIQQCAIDGILIACRNVDCIDGAEDLGVKRRIHFAGHHQQVDAVKERAGRCCQGHLRFV